MNSNQHPIDRIMTAEEVSRFLRLPITTLYGLVARGVIRAVKCGRQWRFRETDVINYLNGVRPASSLIHAQFSEKRLYPRMKTEIPAELTGLLSAAQKIKLQGMISDISEGGIYFVSADPAFDVGHPVRLIFSVPGEKPVPITVDGRVVHQMINGKVGIGIKFRTLSSEEKERIRIYVG